MYNSLGDDMIGHKQNPGNPGDFDLKGFFKQKTSL